MGRKVQYDTHADQHLWSKCLTYLVRYSSAKPLKGLARAARRLARGVLSIAIGLSLCLIGASAEAPSAEAAGFSAKEFAKASLNSKEFNCLNKLYYYESRWNSKATNGSHYGIPQGRSIYLKTATPIEQIRWGMKYNYSRYGSMCKALNHFKTKGWH